MPPRSLKSLCASVAFPAYILGKDPTTEVVTISHNEQVAGHFARQSRILFNSYFFAKAFPHFAIGEKDTELLIETTDHGLRRATSMEASLSGLGGNYIIIDDPIGAANANSTAQREKVNRKYSEELFTRLNNKLNDVIIIVMQRYHVDDLVGHVTKHGGWTVLNLPAIAQETMDIQVGPDEFYTFEKGQLLHAERESQAVLDEMELVLGTDAFNGQYLQRPVQPSGNIFKHKWFKFYQGSPGRSSFSQIVQSWDTASAITGNASFSVCTTWGIRESRAFLLHVYRERLDYPDLRTQVVRHARIWGADRILIENASSGRPLIQELQVNTTLPITPVTPKLDKEDRARVRSIVIENGRIFLPESAEFLDTFLAEILAFPMTKFSDQVDSMTQFLEYFQYGEPKPNTVDVTLYPRKTTFYDRNGGSFPS